MPDIYWKSTCEEYSQENCNIKTKSVLKMYKQTSSSPKTAAYTINKKKQAKYFGKIHEQNHFHQNGRHTTCSFTGNKPPLPTHLPTGNAGVCLKWMTIIKKSLKWVHPKIAIYNES